MALNASDKDESNTRSGISGAAIALCGAYAAMLVAMHLLTRRLFAIAFEWRRLAQAVAILTAVAVWGELLLPSHGLGGLLARVAWLALIPALLLATRFFSATERAGAAELVATLRKRLAAPREPAVEIEAYANDPLKDL